MTLVRRSGGRFARILAASALLWACQLPPEPDVEAEGPVTDFLRTAAATSQESNNYAAAVNYYRRLVERDPNDVDAVLGLARNYRYIASAREAVKVLNDGLARHPDRVDLRAELGKAQVASGQVDDAIATLSEVTEADPDDWRSLSALGIAYDLTEDYAQAQESYRSALAVSPDNNAVLNNMALSMALSGGLDEGIAILEGPAAQPRTGVQVRQNLALLYAMRGDIETAERLLKQGLSMENAQHNLTFYRQLHSRLASRVGRAAPKVAARKQPAAADEGLAPADDGSAQPIGAGAVMVRLGVFPAEERASAWLSALRDVHADLLADLRFEITEFGGDEAAKGYRLLAGPLASEALAADLCTKLHSRKETCTIVVP